jgi:hypothetical protein
VNHHAADKADGDSTCPGIIKKPDDNSKPHTTNKTDDDLTCPSIIKKPDNNSNPHTIEQPDASTRANVESTDTGGSHDRLDSLQRNQVDL